MAEQLDQSTPRYPKDALGEARSLVVRAHQKERYVDQAYFPAGSRYDEARTLALIEIADTLRSVAATLENIETKLS
jgi:hypothetical protein